MYLRPLPSTSGLVVCSTERINSKDVVRTAMFRKSLDCKIIENRPDGALELVRDVGKLN
jgi:hypothetical protein